MTKRKAKTEGGAKPGDGAYARLPKVKKAAPGAAPGAAPVKRGRGRPPVTAEPVTNANVLLLSRQIIALDQFSVDVRRATGGKVNRAAIIRAAVEALLQAGIPPADVRTDADILPAMLSRLAGRGK
jgi:hypothetical protein